MSKIAPYLKAVVGFVAPAAAVLIASVLEKSPAGENITTGEWVTALCAALVTAGGVYGVPNKDPQALHQDESVQPPRNERGEGLLYGLLCVAAVIIVVWLFIALLGHR